METSTTNSSPLRYSVIVPTYNSAITLKACLHSLINQTMSREWYEVIVVDDGSHDNTAEVASGFDVIYISQDNQGPASARNYGVSHAAGDIILFTDADCVPQHDWLEQMSAPFDNPDVTGVKGAYKTRQRELTARFVQAEFEDRYDLLQKSPTIDMVDTYSAAFRKDVFLSVGGFDEHFPVANNEDTDLSYRIASAGYTLVFQPSALVFHTHQHILLNYLKLKFWRGYWRMVVYKRYPHKAVKDSYTPAVLKMQTLLMALSLALLPCLWITPGTLAVLVVLWSGILVSSLPFSVKTYKKDKAVGMISPFIIFLRSLVFAVGSPYGFLCSLVDSGFCKKLLDKKNKRATHVV